MAGLKYGYYRRGTTVRVTAHGDPRKARTGRVVSSYNASGVMVHVVTFRDGSVGHYATDELAERQKPGPQPTAPAEGTC